MGEVPLILEAILSIFCPSLPAVQ